MASVNIQDWIGEIVTSMRATVDGPPYYMYGHRDEIAARLLKKEGSVIKKKQKYPLVILAMDIPRPVVKGVANYLLNIVIVCRTKNEYNVEQRMEQTFKPVLYPLHTQFIEAVRDSGLFMWPGDPSYPDHLPIDRPKWGVWMSEGTLKQYMPDPLDAVEILNLKLNKVIC